MAPSTNLEDKLEGIENFLTWKYRIGLILRDNYLDKYNKNEVPKPEEDEAKEKHQKGLIKAMMIIANSIKDHFVITDLVVSQIDESYTGWKRGQATKVMTYKNPNPQKMDGCHVG